MSASILSAASQAMRHIAGFLTNRLWSEEAKRVRQMNALASEQILQSTQNLTVAGAFALALSADRNPASLLGVEKCYYSPPNFKQVTWVERDIPTPFVGFAAAPGPLASGFINSMQFRYAREIDDPKPNNTCRIFLTGGSTAFGSGASSNETTIGGYLETHLNEALLARGVRCEVITAAAGAWCSTHERILIENRLVELEPDIVISLSGHNDAFWSVLGHNSLWFRAFQDDYFLVLLNSVLAANSAEEFPSQHSNPAMPVSAAKAAERLGRNVQSSHYVLRKVGADYVYALQPVLELSKKVRTQREQQIVKAVGSHPWFIQMHEYYREFSAALRALEQPDLHFFDATSVFDSYNDGTEFFIDTAHFGDRGNDLIGQYLRDQVLPIILGRLRSG